MRFKKGNLTGTLTETQIENHRYKWVNCLALMSDDGRWLSSRHWRTNHFNKAKRELIELGWEIEKPGS